MPDFSLKQRLDADMKAALRAHDKQRLGAVRLILAAVKQREVDERISLEDAQILAVLDKMAKQRRDSIAQFQQAGRQDLVDQENAELAIIQSYLPTPLSTDEIDALITAAIAATGASTPQDMGKVMTALRPEVQGRADMATVSAAVRQRLS